MNTIGKTFTFLPGDVTLLLKDVTGMIQPLPAETREARIQSGVHYSEMLPTEKEPSEAYLAAYLFALEHFAGQTAAAMIRLCDRVYRKKGGDAVLVSLARAGTPIGILLKRCFERRYGISPRHYTISIIRGKGIDTNAMDYLLSRYEARRLQFVDGWTGKGAISAQLSAALADYSDIAVNRDTLAVLSDPANITDVCGTHEDILIASSCLNSTVCGLMSRTILNRDIIGESDFHGVTCYQELRDFDRTYEFIDRIDREMIRQMPQKNLDNADEVDMPNGDGLAEVQEIARRFGIRDINFVKPGLGETVRVLLRRVPQVVLIAEHAEPRYIAHILTLAKEKNVTVMNYPLVRYKACGIIKDLSDL
jgi:hypothetical protein